MALPGFEHATCISRKRHSTGHLASQRCCHFVAWFSHPIVSMVGDKCIMIDIAYYCDLSCRRIYLTCMAETGVQSETGSAGNATSVELPNIATTRCTVPVLVTILMPMSWCTTAVTMQSYQEPHTILVIFLGIDNRFDNPHPTVLYCTAHTLCCIVLCLNHGLLVLLLDRIRYRLLSVQFQVIQL